MGSQSSKDAARREAEERRLKESKPLRPQPANCFLSPHYTYPHACRSMCYRSEQLEMTPGEVAEIKCLVAAATPVDNAAIASPNTIQADLDALVESDEPLKIIIDTVSTVRRLPPPSARQRASTTVWPAITPTSCAPHHPSLPPYSFLAPPVSASSHPRSRMRSPSLLLTSSHLTLSSPALKSPPSHHRQDVGTDADDVLALVAALNLPTEDVEILGLTTNYYPAKVRKRVAEAVLAAAGRGDIPVVAGSDYVMGTHRGTFLVGNEGEGLPDLSEEELAALAAAREEERRAQLKRCDLLSVDDRLVRTL